jgi:hypothetical protein
MEEIQECTYQMIQFETNLQRWSYYNTCSEGIQIAFFDRQYGFVVFLRERLGALRVHWSGRMPGVATVDDEVPISQPSGPYSTIRLTPAPAKRRAASRKLGARLFSWATSPLRRSSPMPKGIADTSVVACALVDAGVRALAGKDPSLLPQEIQDLYEGDAAEVILAALETLDQFDPLKLADLITAIRVVRAPRLPG